MTDFTDSVAIADGGIGSIPAPAIARVCPLCQEAYPTDFVVCPRDGARLEEQPAGDDPLLGAVLGDAFRIVKPIGEGATARVYEASHVRLGKKRFAVKVLHPFYGAEPTALARFQREAESAAAIAHPGIVDVYDINRTPDGRFYIVTELLEGKDFATLLEERGKVDVALGVRIAREVCRALAAAHERGVIHRDMKPENVFLAGNLQQPRIKVLDFGISKVEDGANLTQTGMLVGTPAYMAPEQAVGEKIDARTDVYAVGALLYHCLTGRLPFAGEETAEVLSGILCAEPPRPCSLEPAIPEGLELVIQKAMSKQKDDRYDSALALERALGPFDSVDGAVTGPVSQRADAREAKRARPLLAALVVLAALWLVGTIDVAVLALLARADTPGDGAGVGRFIIVTLGTLVVIAAPGYLLVRHLKSLWPSTPKVIQVGQRVLTTLLAAVATYAAASIVIKALEIVSVGPGGFGAVRELTLTLMSYAAGGIGYLSTLGKSA